MFSFGWIHNDGDGASVQNCFPPARRAAWLSSPPPLSFSFSGHTPLHLHPRWCWSWQRTVGSVCTRPVAPAVSRPKCRPPQAGHTNSGSAPEQVAVGRRRDCCPVCCRLSAVPPLLSSVFGQMTIAIGIHRPRTKPLKATSPRMKRTVAISWTHSCHQPVFVLAGISATTVQPRCHSL